ncbi:MAG: aa3-type cytochrome c oxidase subunit IV [Rhodobacteraceae bacterium]|nr:aa3-type cytochrome c oxidase subunit IV [Paracoccaceae bacterium]
MADHKHGEMDTEAQSSTFDGFMHAMKVMTIIIIGILVFMAIFTS